MNYYTEDEMCYTRSNKGIRQILETSYRVIMFAAYRTNLFMSYQGKLATKNMKQSLTITFTVQLPAHGKTGRVSLSHFLPVPVKYKCEK